MTSVLRHLLALLLLIAILLIIYRPALAGDYLFDDVTLIRDHPHLNDVSGLVTIWTNPVRSPDYYPLTYTSWWIERRIFGGAASASPPPASPTSLLAAGSSATRPSEPRAVIVAHHVGNVILHAINSLLVWLLLRRLRATVAVALLAAAIFALHPVHVESVAWMSERKDVLSGLFYFLSLLAFIRAVTLSADSKARPGENHQPSADSPPPDSLSLPFLALSIIFFIGAMFSKPVTMTMAAAIPLVLWLLHAGRPHAPQRGFPWDRLWLSLPYFLFTVPMILLTLWIQKHHVLTEGPDFDLTFAQRIVLSGRVFWFYLFTDLWPANLAFAYPRWVIDAGSFLQWLAPISAAALFAALWLLRRRISVVPVIALAYFVITLSPALGYFNIFWHTYYYVVDHVQYLACLAPITLAACVLMWIARLPLPRREGVRGVGEPSEPRASSFDVRISLPQLAVSALVLIPLALVSANRAAPYTDSIALWTDVVERYPDSFLGQSNLGICLMNDRADAASAVAPLEKAAHLRPEFAMVHFHLGRAYNGANRRADAVRAWETAIRINPNDGPAHLARSAIAKLRPGQISEEPKTP